MKVLFKAIVPKWNGWYPTLSQIPSLYTQDHVSQPASTSTAVHLRLHSGYLVPRRCVYCTTIVGKGKEYEQYQLVSWRFLYFGLHSFKKGKRGTEHFNRLLQQTRLRSKSSNSDTFVSYKTKCNYSNIYSYHKPSYKHSKRFQSTDHLKKLHILVVTDTQFGNQTLSNNLLSPLNSPATLGKII